MAYEQLVARRARRRLCSEADELVGPGAFACLTESQGLCQSQETFASAGVAVLRDLLKRKIQVGGQKFMNAKCCVRESGHSSMFEVYSCIERFRTTSWKVKGSRDESEGKLRWSVMSRGPRKKNTQTSSFLILSFSFEGEGAALTKQGLGVLFKSFE